MRLHIGSLNDVLEAYNLLKAGTPIYIASSSTPSDEMRLLGAWTDEFGNVYFDYSAVYLDRQDALQVARANQQQCILALYPAKSGRGRVYLLRNTPSNRQVALRTCGGYTADKEWLITAVDSDRAPFKDYIDAIPVVVEFVPVE